MSRLVRTAKVRRIDGEWTTLVMFDDYPLWRARSRTWKHAMDLALSWCKEVPDAER